MTDRIPAQSTFLRRMHRLVPKRGRNRLNFYGISEEAALDIVEQYVEAVEAERDARGAGLPEEAFNKVTLNGACPVCKTDLNVSGKVRDPAKHVALAFYGGVPGGKDGTDAERLRAIAEWLDRVDDATDGEFMTSVTHRNHRVGRDVQQFLREMADKSDSMESSN